MFQFIVQQFFSLFAIGNSPYKYKLLKILETTVKFRKRVHRIGIKL